FTSFLFYFMILPPPRSPLFPYTTLFRSRRERPSRYSIAAARTGSRGDDCRGLLRVRFGVSHAGNHAGAASSEKENRDRRQHARGDRKSTRLNSSHLGISYAVFCLKKKKK